MLYLSSQRIPAAAIATLLILLCLPHQVEGAFRFAVSSDQRGYAGPGSDDQVIFFRGVCEALNFFGQGIFMISPGDIDPVEDSQWTIEQYLGTEYHWFPVVGNHELPGAGGEDYEGANMELLRAWDIDPNGPGIPPDPVNIGPSGCPETTYSFDYENAHFVVLNQYCDYDGDAVTRGDIPDHLYDWLAADLQATSLEHIFVFGHEPAFPQPDADSLQLHHIKDSLNYYVSNRDRFWDLLRTEGVAAYFCGHTHSFSAAYLDGVWQLDSGQARGAGDQLSPSTFLVVDVDGTTVTFDAYRDSHDGIYDYADIVRHGVITPAPELTTLVPSGAMWRYLDDGSDQGSAWIDPGFVDDCWAEGPAQLGYGDGDEATVLDFGPDPENKYITSYFRHTFTVTDPAAWSGFWIHLLRDDGAMVHLNGTRVFKSNLPEDEITYMTLADLSVIDAEEVAFLQYEVDPGLLVPGDNVLAVEIHQAVVDSTDIGFDLKLLGYRTPAVIVASDLTCVPDAGTLPFSSQFTVRLENRYAGTSRQIAARIDVSLADGLEILNWRQGFTTVSAEGENFTTWSQTLPAVGTLVGLSTFALSAADVTPAPWNQPPYPPSGETATGSCTVTGLTP